MSPYKCIVMPGLVQIKARPGHVLLQLVMYRLPVRAETYCLLMALILYSFNLTELYKILLIMNEIICRLSGTFQNLRNSRLSGETWGKSGKVKISEES